MSVIFFLLLLTASVLLSAMSAGFKTLSTSHLRYWAKQKDQAAKKLYPLKARGSSVYLTIELLRAMTVSALVVVLCSAFTAWFAWLAIVLLSLVAFIILTELYLKPLGIRLLVWLSGAVLGLTHALKFFMLPLGYVFDKFIDNEPITLTRDELQHMLDAVSPEDTDLSKDELRILNGVLQFSRSYVRDVMTPASKVITVPASESLTPIILDSLYKTGHENFPVLGDDKKTVVGLLNMHRITDIRQNSAVLEAMQQKVHFVDEDRELDHVLQVFYKTKQTVFIVLNSASDMVGVITMEDVLQKIMGKPNSKIDSKKDKETETSGDASPTVVK